MKKYFILLISAVSLFVFFGFSISAGAHKTDSKTAIARPTPKNKISIRSVELDQYKAELRCPMEIFGGFKIEGARCSEDPSIKITTSVINPKNSEITYYYTVSAGKIVGQGANVSWELKNVRPGEYTVTVGIGSKSKVFGETITKTIKIGECDVCDLPCVCPTLDVSGGGDVKAGENVTFRANVVGGSDTANPTFKWTISQGEIIAGQGTTQITVKTTSEMSGTIEATVEFSAPGLCSACYVMTVSETATIIQ